MADTDILRRLSEKGADIDALLDEIVENRRCLPLLIEALQNEKGTAKYAYEKTLRRLSERQPELLYSNFDVFVGLLDQDNSFLKWGGIMTVANLTAVDTENKFEAVFKKYYAPVAGPALVTAANIIGSSVKIAQSKPLLTAAITKEILKVEKARFINRGSPSPECRNVAIGQAIDAFDGFLDQIENKNAVIQFVKRQLRNTRKQVVKKAERFLKKHSRQG